MKRLSSFPVVMALISGVITLGFGYLGFISLENIVPSSWDLIWIRWDTAHYLAIAEGGYFSGPPILICFLPLFPLFIKGTAILVHDPLLAAILVSNIAFAVALSFLYKLVLIDFDRKVSELAVIFCVCFPTAYFFHIAYSESLYFALSLGSLYMARKDRWWLAGCLGLLAALCRLPGLVLCAALAVEYLQQRRFRMDTIRWNAVFLLFPALGFGIYLLINLAVNGTPFQFLKTFESNFFRHLSPPIEGFLSSWVEMFFSSPTTRFEIWGANLIYLLLSAGVLGWSARRLRYSYTTYGLSLWVLIFCSNVWLSVPRHLMMMFPMYIFAALLVERRPVLRHTVLLTSVLLYALGTIQFVRGWWAN